MALWRLIFFLIVLAAAGLSFVPLAYAVDPILSGELPSMSQQPTLSLMNQGLGSACLVVGVSPRGLPCNPADASLDEPGHHFVGRLFVGGEYAKFKTLNELLHGPRNQALMESLFKENQVIDTQATADLTLRWNIFGASFTPYHLSYFSVVRNEAYPVIALQAMQERIVKLQVGGYLGTPQLKAGLQVRFVQRELIQNEFSLYDAVLRGEGVLTRKDQNVVYVEPGVSWIAPGTWKPKFSALLSNMGFTDHELPETKLSPTIDTGFGVTPPLGAGNLEAGFTYRVSDMSANLWDRFGLGADYRLGLIETLLGWSPLYTNFGLMSSFWSTHVAVLFSSRRYEMYDGSFAYNSSIMTEFGFEF